VGEGITSVCSKFDLSKATKYYRELFEFEKEMLRADRGRLFSPTATTNYDLVFEQCAKKIQTYVQRLDFGKSMAKERYL
jgi:hypothetical protein